MSKIRFLVVPLAALIVIGLLILGGFAIHRIGWTEGYRMGQLADSGGGAVAPYESYGFGYPSLFLTVGLLLLALIVIGKIFRFWAWKMAWGPWMMAGRPWRMAAGPKGERWARHWASHWHRPHGPMPPWCWGWEEPSEEKAEQAEPDAEASAAEA
jgi:hypothetical protein